MKSWHFAWMKAHRTLPPAWHPALSARRAPATTAAPRYRRLLPDPVSPVWKEITGH